MMKRRRCWFALALAIAATTAYAQATQVENSSFVAADGTRTLHKASLPATLPILAAFTTSGDLHLGAPVAQVDLPLRTGTSFQIDGKIGAAGKIERSLPCSQRMTPRNRQAPLTPCLDGLPSSRCIRSPFFDVVGERATRDADAAGRQIRQLYDGVWQALEEGNAWSQGTSSASRRVRSTGSGWPRRRPPGSRSNELTFAQGDQRKELSP
jgi:hypothetical protein